MTVTVKLNGIEISVEQGTLISDVVGMEKPCGGHGRCGKCKVIARGDLSELTENEKNHLTH